MHNPDRPKRIHLIKGPESRHEENVAGAVITPGMLIKLNNLNKVIPHNVAGGPAEINYAVEDALQGGTIGDNYINGSVCSSIIAARGDVVYAILADGENAQPGDLLSSNGDGYMQVRSGTESSLAIALEHIDASGSSDALEDRRIRIRVL